MTTELKSSMVSGHFDAFASKEDLIAARVRHLELKGMDRSVASIKVRSFELKYHPHVYCGGWVIRGFGYSTERIGKYITAEAAGTPEAV